MDQSKYKNFETHFAQMNLSSPCSNFWAKIAFSDLYVEDLWVRRKRDFTDRAGKVHT